MDRKGWTLGLVGLGLLLLAAGGARADRVPSSKTVLPPSTGARTDITVPYLTNGNSAAVDTKKGPYPPAANHPWRRTLQTGKKEDIAKGG